MIEASDESRVPNDCCARDESRVANDCCGGAMHGIARPQQITLPTR